MVAKNDVTGDSIQTKSSATYGTGWDAIWGKKEKCRGCGDCACKEKSDEKSADAEAATSEQSPNV